MAEVNALPEGGDAETDGVRSLRSYWKDECQDSDRVKLEDVERTTLPEREHLSVFSAAFVVIPSPPVDLYMHMLVRIAKLQIYTDTCIEIRRIDGEGRFWMQVLGMEEGIKRVMKLNLSLAKETVKWSSFSPHSYNRNMNWCLTLHGIPNNVSKKKILTNKIFRRIRLVDRAANKEETKQKTIEAGRSTERDEMTVPPFFQWLSKKFPSIIVNANEERQRDANGVKIPIDSTHPNANFQEFDNLYLDMNGIIHLCTHSEDKPAPRNEDEMFVLIFEYIDRIFSIVRPRRVLYMAIDGVAPRAKMNQQRSRRFRASKEMAEKEMAIDNVRQRLAAEGLSLPPKKAPEEHFDSNCITAGTPFMARLAHSIRYFIHERLTNNPAWARIQVILSDSSVPGEAKHKVMDFVRKQRASPSHDPDTVHCLYGTNDDLIMLGLATHEANFNIIREEFVAHRQRPCDLCGQYGHELEGCQGVDSREKEANEADPVNKEKNFIFIRIPVLREYLERELAMPNSPFKYDFERVIDDWVFLSFFVSNDYLPHLPSLKMTIGTFCHLVKICMEKLWTLNGFLTQDGEVNVRRVHQIMMELATVEEFISKKRESNHLRRKEKLATKKANIGETQGTSLQKPAAGTNNLSPEKTSRLEEIGEVGQKEEGEEKTDACSRKRKSEESMEMAHRSAENGSKFVMDADDVEFRREVAAEYARGLSWLLKNYYHEPVETAHGSAVKEEEKDEEPVDEDDVDFRRDVACEKARGLSWLLKNYYHVTVEEEHRSAKKEEENYEEPVDEVRLYEEGWKNRYYRSKFVIDTDDVDFRREVAWSYVRGLCWVLKYYYQGCVSWDWYFPYHYAPFASEFDTVDKLVAGFDLETHPLKPLEHLMSVLPAASKQHLPEHWQTLMTSPESNIIDFYPTDFKIDLSGKKFGSQEVALLPFVDEKRLLRTVKTVYPTLTDEEAARNSTGPDRLFVGSKHPAFKFLKKLYEDGAGQDAIQMEPSLAYGMTGAIRPDPSAILPGVVFPSPVRAEECPDLKENGGIMVIYTNPSFPDGFIFPARKLEGAKDMKCILKPGESKERTNCHTEKPRGPTPAPVGRASLDTAIIPIQHPVAVTNRDGGGYGSGRGGYGSGQGGYGERGGGCGYDNYGGGRYQREGGGGEYYQPQRHFDDGWQVQNQGGEGYGSHRGGEGYGSHRGGFTLGGGRGGFLRGEMERQPRRYLDDWNGQNDRGRYTDDEERYDTRSGGCSHSGRGGGGYGERDLRAGYINNIGGAVPYHHRQRESHDQWHSQNQSYPSGGSGYGNHPRGYNQSGGEDGYLQQRGLRTQESPRGLYQEGGYDRRDGRGGFYPGGGEYGGHNQSPWRGNNDQGGRGGGFGGQKGGGQQRPHWNY